MYATLFGESPVGAAGPITSDDYQELTQDQISSLQGIAASVVLEHSGALGVPHQGNPFFWLGANSRAVREAPCGDYGYYELVANPPMPY